MRELIYRDITPIVFTGTDNFAIDRVSVDGLPPGLNFATGSINADFLWEMKITGRATQTGVYPIVVNIRDKEGNKGIPVKFDFTVYA